LRLFAWPAAPVERFPDEVAHPPQAKRRTGLSMAHDIFICHAHADLNTASAACAKLEDAGVRCWIAPRDVDAGPYARQLVHAITNASAILLIFSNNTNASEHILRELEVASKHQKVIVPFRIEDVQPNEDLEYFTSRVHWLDALSPPMEIRLAELVVFVKRLLAAKPAPTSTPVPVTTPASSLVEAARHQVEPAAPPPQPVPWWKTHLRVLVGAVAAVVTLLIMVIAIVSRRPSHVAFPIRTFAPIYGTNLSAPLAIDRSMQNCPMDRAEAAEDFSHGATQWGKLPSTIQITHGFLSVRPAKGHFALLFHDGKFHADGTVCAKLGAYGPHMPPTSVNTTAGVIFWDYTPPKANDDYYVFQVNYEGNFTAWHRSQNKWTLLRGPTHSNAIRTHAGIYNFLAVRTSGHTASLYVNGTKVDTVSGNPPAGGWWGGVIAALGPDEGPDAAWNFGAYGAAVPGSP
jgi:hypothetical protein